MTILKLTVTAESKTRQGLLNLVAKLLDDLIQHDDIHKGAYGHTKYGTIQFEFQEKDSEE